jgi:hypothetical protein
LEGKKRELRFRLKLSKLLVIYLLLEKENRKFVINIKKNSKKRKRVHNKTNLLKKRKQIQLINR